MASDLGVELSSKRSRLLATIPKTTRRDHNSETSPRMGNWKGLPTTDEDDYNRCYYAHAVTERERENEGEKKKSAVVISSVVLGMCY